MLEQLAADLSILERTERLDWLISKGELLPELDDEMSLLRDSGMHSIIECMAPVFFFVRIKEGHFYLSGDVPQEAPIARGLLGFLISTFHGEPIRELPNDLLEFLHLRECLSMQRQRGLTAIYHRLSDQVGSG